MNCVTQRKIMFCFLTPVTPLPAIQNWSWSRCKCFTLLLTFVSLNRGANPVLLLLFWSELVQQTAFTKQNSFLYTDMQMFQKKEKQEMYRSIKLENILK